MMHLSAYTLGNLYVSENDAVDKDMQKAVSWWRTAGQHGFPPAMGNVGAFHLNEVLEGIDQKNDVASKAKDAGHEKAKIEYDAVMELRNSAEQKQAKKRAAQ